MQTGKTGLIKKQRMTMDVELMTLPMDSIGVVDTGRETVMVGI